jgi:hypothetical protein
MNDELWSEGMRWDIMCEGPFRQHPDDVAEPWDDGRDDPGCLQPGAVGVLPTPPRGPA